MLLGLGKLCSDRGGLVKLDSIFCIYCRFFLPSVRSEPEKIVIISQIPVLGSSMDEKKRILCTETIKYVGGSIAKRPLPLAAKPASSRMILIVGLLSLMERLSSADA